MSLKSRILRILLILLLIGLFAGYFAFSTFLFNPMEGDLDADVAALVPRDVDFFASRADLDEAFEHFPRLKVMKQLEQHPGWLAFNASPEYGALTKDLQIEETLAALETQLKQIPLGLEPQQIFGGEDLALAGYFKGRDVAGADWAAYGTVNWMGKLGVELLRHPGLIGLEKQGLKAVADKDWIELSGRGLPRAMYLARVKNVVIASTKPELAKAAHDLFAKRFEDSFFQSAAYFDHIQNANRNAQRDEFEVYLNTRKMMSELALPGTWPDTKSQDFTPAFLGKLFQLKSLKSVLGVIDIDQGVSLDLHGDFSSELITPEQAKLYRARGFDRDELLGEVARLAPSDTSLFVYMRAHIGDLLRQMLASCEPALKTNLETAFRNTGKYASLDPLITELDAALKDRVALIVRPNDYPEDPEGPPHNNDPTPAIALVLWTQNAEAIANLRELIGSQGAKFGLQGRTPNEPGYFRNTEAGFDIREFWSQFVPGTGMIATVNAGELTIVTNSFRMLGHILKTYTQGGDKYPRLADNPRFESMVQSSLRKANLVVWANPKTAAPVLRKQAEQVAKNSIQIDWKSERAREEDKAIRESLPGKKRGTLTTDEQEQIDKIVDPRLAAIEQKIKGEQIPALMAQQMRYISYIESVTGALMMLSLDPKFFDLSVRLTAPLEVK